MRVEFSHVDQARMELRRGQLAMLNSRKGEALYMFERAKSMALERAVPYDEALAYLELGMTSEDEATTTMYIYDAAKIFKRLGCDWHLRRCHAMLATRGITVAAI